MPTTYPNQRTIHIHRQPAQSPFLGIKNENWQRAARDLGAYALMLYLYLAANANDFTLALSPVAVREAIGMANSTYRDQVQKLIDRGYLVPSHGNTFEFYEVPQTRVVDTTKNEAATTATEQPGAADQNLRAVSNVEPQSREINNTATSTTNGINNQSGEMEIRIPEVKEVVITRPVATGRKRPAPRETPKREGFEF